MFVKNEVLEQMKSRRSVRRYQSDMVPGRADRSGSDSRNGSGLRHESSDAGRDCRYEQGDP